MLLILAGLFMFPLGPNQLSLVFADGHEGAPPPSPPGGDPGAPPPGGGSANRAKRASGSCVKLPAFSLEWTGHYGLAHDGFTPRI